MQSRVWSRRVFFVCVLQHWTPLSVNTCVSHPHIDTGPCELLLTTANLIIVLGLRDACREGAQPHPPPPSQQQPGDVNTVDDDNSTASTRQQAIQSVEDADALSQAAHHQPNSSSPGLSVQPPHAASLHQLPSAESHPHRRAPGIVRSLSGQCPHVWQRQAGRQLHHSSSRTARSRVPAGVACRPMRLAVAGVC